MSVSPGRRFMIDLLVSSLMADGGLESALNAAITAEIQVSVSTERGLVYVSSYILCNLCRKFGNSSENELIVCVAGHRSQEGGPEREGD